MHEWDYLIPWKKKLHEYLKEKVGRDEDSWYTGGKGYEVTWFLKEILALLWKEIAVPWNTGFKKAKRG